MFEWIKTYQLDIMLLLCGACGVLIILLLAGRFFAPRRKAILILMELTASFLLWFDRMTYVFAGQPGTVAYVMVRVSNFFVFFLTSGIVFGFNLFLIDWLEGEGGMKTVPLRLRVVSLASILGMALAVISAFTGLYYTFDSNNLYQREPGFLIAYIIPVLCPLVQFTVFQQYRKVFSKLIYVSVLLYIFVPLVCGIIQIFAYGISITNMAMVVVSIGLYVFSLLDINLTVQHAHEIEIQTMRGERKRMQRVFDQTAKAFVSAVEQRDDFSKGKAARVADYAKRIAALAGKEEEECEQIYYAALLHDVGMIGIPDSVMKNEENPGQEDYEVIRQKPLIGKEILSRITEYPYLSAAVASSHERYNGTGYPNGTAGDAIPEMARIIAVADAYVTMTSPKHYRPARPAFVAREALVKGEGVEFDPAFAKLMVQIIDADSREEMQEEETVIETALTCGTYRDAVTNGIPIERGILDITFDCVLTEQEGVFSAPSLLLFDSYDRRVHADRKTIDAYNYLEYGEIWFDAPGIITAARKLEEHLIDPQEVVLSDTEEGAPDSETAGDYRIIVARYEDHLKLKMRSPSGAKEVIVALPDGSKSVFLGLTGEHCTLSKINVTHTGRHALASDILRIAPKLSYIDRMESDIPNVQIDRTRSASTEGIAVKAHTKLIFHTQSLPGASLVWHCPYLVLFSSDDAKVGGENYHEYALIKLNGENEGDFTAAKNRFVMKKTDRFPGWDAWKEKHLAGIECEAQLEHKGKQVVLTTETLGIHIENTTTILEEHENVYIALTGDQCAITDIRVN
ncbi:MAG: HD domain-containing protein [Lachnospiraceae bacterium]|nr:HD domain-containing protein [Lachnospiraceae bacterium]